jgi:hypothetical protein
MGNDYKPDPKAFVDNLKAPMPLQKKLFLFLKNNARKIVTRKSCCGHPGEPGC